MNNDAQARSIFLNTLQWLMAVTDRYASDFNFALVKIAYGNKNELGDAYGAPEASKQLSSLTTSLQKTFRKADLIARNGTDFWIIFPYTPFSENIYEKIRGVIDDADHEELNIVNREIAIYLSPFEIDYPNNDEFLAIDLLNHLKQHQSQFAQHVFKIAPAEQLT